MQNYPNPFNPSTEISFTLDKTFRGRLGIYNIKGQKICTLAKDNFEKDVNDKIRYIGIRD